MKEKKKNETKKMIGEIAILLILMGLTFSVLLRDQDLGEVVASVFSVRKRWLIPAVLCMGVYIFCGGLCIRVMQHGLGHKMSIARCFKYSFVEFYFSAITPSSTGGQPMQLVYMKKDGYNVSESSVILVAITAMYKLAFVLLCLVMFALNYNYISGQIDEVHVMFVLGLILDVGMVLLLGLAALLPPGDPLSWQEAACSLLVKLHLVKAPEKKLASVDRIIEQYRECSEFVRTHPMIILRTFGVLTDPENCDYRCSVFRLPFLWIPWIQFHSDFYDAASADAERRDASAPWFRRGQRERVSDSVRTDLHRRSDLFCDSSFARNQFLPGVAPGRALYYRTPFLLYLSG